MTNLKRRDFIKLAGGATVASLVLPNELLANDGSGFNDFKALVVVEFSGGNDALNMFIPTDDATNSTTGYNYYAKARDSEVRVDSKDLMSKLKTNVANNGYLEFANAKDNPYYVSDQNIKKSYISGYYLLDKKFQSKIAVNAMMPEIAYWLDRGKGAVIQNVGSIIEPTTKQLLRDRTIKRPPFLFSHNQQARVVRVGQAHSITIPVGWLGAVADAWSGINPSTIYAQNINLSKFGRYKMFFGNNTMPMSYSSSGPTGFDNFNSDLHKDIDNLSGGKFEKLYKKTQKSIILQSEKTVIDWKNVNGASDIFIGLKDSYGNDIVIVDAENNYTTTLPTAAQYGLETEVETSFIEPFQTAVKLIKIAEQEGLKRVAISIVLGGFDQHSTQAINHSQKIRGFSMGVDRLMRGLDKIGKTDSTTMFTLSEFARSTGSNGGGTDHAWGGPQLVMGGAVNSGIYGEFPDLTLGGDQDYSRKGRIIPTTSFSQYYATILKWFGGDDALIKKALPEVVNFTTKDLGFMKV